MSAFACRMRSGTFATSIAAELPRVGRRADGPPLRLPRTSMRYDPRMQIWVDADACPSVIKDILFRAAARVRVPVTLVANRWLAMPRSPWIRSVQVAGGFHVADREIVARMTASDVVVTADIHLPRWSSRRAAWLSIPEASCTPTPTSANTLRGATSWTNAVQRRLYMRAKVGP